MFFPVIGFANLFIGALCYFWDDSYLNGISLGLSLLGICVTGAFSIVIAIASAVLSAYQAFA